MKKLQFTDKVKIDAACQIIGVLGEIRKGRDISVIRMKLASEILRLSEIGANSFNMIGCVYGIKGGKILYEKTWHAVREERKACGIDEPEKMTAQTVLTGDEDIFVSVQNHKEEGDSSKRWISMDVFMCPPGRTFRIILRSLSG